MPPQAIPVLVPQGCQALANCSHFASGTEHSTALQGKDRQLCLVSEGFDGPNPGEMNAPLLLFLGNGRLQRPKPLKTPEQSPVWPGDVTSLCIDLQAKLPRRHSREAQHHGWILCVPSMARCKYCKHQHEILDRNNYRFSPDFCASWNQFSFPLHGNKGTYVKMKFDNLYKAQLKLGTATKTFMARGKIKIAERAKLWSSINFVYQHRVHL